MAQTPDRTEQLNQTSAFEIASKTVRKDYHPPHLHHYGHLLEITQTSNPPAGAIDDGGGIPIYTS